MSSTYSSFGSASYQLCQRCGKPLAPNEVQCSNCGYINVPQQANAVQPSSPAWGQPLSPSGQQWQPPSAAASGGSAKGQFVPQLPFGPTSSLFVKSQQPAAPAQNSSMPQQSFMPSPPSQPLTSSPSGGLQPGAGTFPPFTSPGSQPPSQPLTQPSGPNWLAGTGNLNGPQGGGFAQPPAQFSTGGLRPANDFSSPQFAWGQPPSGMLNPENADQIGGPKRRPRTGVIIGLVALVIIILAGSLGGFLYLKSHSTPSVQATPTPTPIPSPTGTPLFADQFTNNNNGWDLTSKPGQFSVKVGNGSMVLEDDNNRLLWEIVPGGKNFSDFFLTVDATLSKGVQRNGYGIYIRGTSDQSLDIATYYRFEIYGDGTYAIFKGNIDAAGVSSSQPLASSTTTTSINPAGKVNHIAISAKGATLTFYVNGQKLKTIVDNTYASGSVALFVSNLPQAQPGAAATFSNLSIYPPQSWA